MSGAGGGDGEASGWKNPQLAGLSGAGDAAAADDVDQLELLAELAAFDGGVQPAFPAPKHQADAGPGRPKGALNKKTLTLTRYYRAKGFRDPIAAMGELVSADPVALRDWFLKHRRVETRTVTRIRKGVALLVEVEEREEVPSLAEIVKLQKDAAADLAPYLHGKQPIKVEVDGERLPVLIIDLGTDQLRERTGRFLAASDEPLSAGVPIDAEYEEIQGDSAGETEKSHAENVSRSGEDADGER